MVLDKPLTWFSHLTVPREDWLELGARRLPLRLVRNHRARRYILRLTPDGAARVTVPRGGNLEEARRFASRNAAWLERQLLRHAQRPAGPLPWRLGDQVWFRGDQVRIMAGEGGLAGCVCFGTESLGVPDPSADLRPLLERHLGRLAVQELPPRVLEFAARHGFHVNRVTVRNQRSRWGSCSPRGTISLNWRLIQTPPWVSDYLILHELAHLRHMNHSARFWSEVERICPWFREAERWLKGMGRLLR